jgi:hypothetical protein
VIAAERHEAGVRGRRIRLDVHEPALRGARCEAEQVGEPRRRQSGGASERHCRVDVRRRDDRPSLGERRPDLPAEAEREIGGIEQQQRARRRRPRGLIGHRQVLKDA